ncbi:MAG: LamG domain-containing protein, partial [Planctomycetota bacterium]
MKDNIQQIMKLLFLAIVAICFYPFSTYAQSVSEKGKKVPQPAKDGLFYMWLFDEGVAGHQFSTIYDTDNYWMDEYQTNFYQDTFKGNFQYVEGVSGTAVKFDGFTARIIRTYIKVPDLTDGFSFEGWVAPYSTRRAAIVSQEKDFKQGFIFGLFDGHLGIQMSLNGEWVQCKSNVNVTLLKWSHIAVTFEEDKGINLYINGEPVGSLAIKGKMTDARKEDLLIGMSSPKELRLREMGGKFPPIDKKLYYHMAFDGLLDEFKLYEQALTAEDIKDLYNEFQLANKQPLKKRQRPIPPKIENARFGASCCRLRYYDEYEEVQRIGDYADILVRFDLSPARLMFVHSNTYIPIWVTENDRMISDQSVEINGKNGFYEVMMDKQNRYSHVRLLENHDARVVVHWRYALCDRFYEIARPDEMTNWGDWADEYYTIYPDGVAVRHWVYYTSTFGKDYLQFQETILHPQPGQTSDDNVELEALTLANMAGQTHTYSWADGVPPYFPKPEAANIQLVNMKSQYKPYIIFEHGSRVDKYIWGYRKGRGYHVSSCLASGLPVVTKGKKRNSYEAVALYGMTEKPINSLLPLAKSWIEPPELNLNNSVFTSNGYDKYQRAYVLACKRASTPSILEFELAASKD